MLTKEQLDAIKARVEIATPGEWGLGVYRVYNDKFKAVAETLHFEDAKFIAHARQDVPALIAEVERLQRFEKQVQQINNAADRLENGEIDGFDFGEIVLDIL